MSWFAPPTHVEPYTADDGLRGWRVADPVTRAPYLMAPRVDWLAILATLALLAGTFLAGVMVGHL